MSPFIICQPVSDLHADVVFPSLPVRYLAVSSFPRCPREEPEIAPTVSMVHGDRVKEPINIAYDLLAREDLRVRGVAVPIRNRCHRSSLRRYQDR